MAKVKKTLANAAASIQSAINSATNTSGIEAPEQEEKLKSVYISAEEAENEAIIVKCPYCGKLIPLKTDYEETDEGKKVMPRPIRTCGRDLWGKLGCGKDFHFEIGGPLDLVAKRFKALEEEENVEEIEYTCDYEEKY